VKHASSVSHGDAIECVFIHHGPRNRNRQDEFVMIWKAKIIFSKISSRLCALFQKTRTGATRAREKIEKIHHAKAQRRKGKKCGGWPGRPERAAGSRQRQEAAPSALVIAQFD
jgi:hypothetical protein